MLICVIRSQHPTCTPGLMTMDGKSFGHTLELPWRDNRNGESCIPPGRYPVRIFYSPRFGRDTILILDVPNRAGIRIHGANRADQLRGCIAVAKNRPTPDTIQGDLSRVLEGMAKAAIARGEKVEIEIQNKEVT